MDFPHLVLARVYEHIEPLDRGDRYEDPLQATLEKMGIGRVTGGGSQLNELGAIAYADVEIELANVDEALGIVAEALEVAAAPQGSELIQIRYPGLLELSHEVELSSMVTRSLAQLQRILNIADPDSHRTLAVSQKN